MMNRLTWREPNGDWGLKGLSDWNTIQPAVYGALYKLKKLEDQMENVAAAMDAEMGSPSLESLKNLLCEVGELINV